jgi:hypothetical protein
MNGIARRLLGGGLGSSSKDAPPPNEPQQQQPPAVAPLAIGGGKTGAWSPASMVASARSMTGRSDDTPVGQSPTSPPERTRTGSVDAGVVDESTIRQRPARTTSKGSGSIMTAGAMSPPPPVVRAPLPPNGGGARPVLNTRNVVPKNRTGVPSNGMVNTKDELLMSLLASEAVVDSRDSEILSSEQVEELKKVRPNLPIYFHN